MCLNDEILRLLSSVVRTYSNSVDNQTEVEICVYEGEEVMVNENHLLLDLCQ